MAPGDGNDIPRIPSPNARHDARPGLATPGEDAAWDALRERVSLTFRPVGSSAALGFLGLAAATWALAALQLGWVAATEARTVALVLLAFAFGAQALASVFAFLSRDGGAGTALAQLALVWLVLGTTMLLLEPGETSDALGVFLVFAGVSLLLSGAVTATGKLVPAAVFALAGIRFLTAAVYELSSSEIWEDVSGVVGLVLALLAIYAASAVQLEEALGRPVLPLGRRGRGRIALRGSLLEQVKEAPNAPGVRVQL